MPKVFTQALGDDEVDPYAEVLKQMLLRQQSRVQEPTFSPEQIAQRRADNANQYDLGMLAQLSGHPAASALGGQIFKQALADRTPKVTERGSYDPITQQYTYDPEYLREKDQGNIDRMLAAQAAYQAQRSNRIFQNTFMAGQKQLDREAAGERARVMAGSNLIAVTDPATGQPVLVPKTQAAGMAPGSEGKDPTEAQAGAASYAERMVAASAILNRFEKTGHVNAAQRAMGALPKVGDAAQGYTLSPEQQAYKQAQRTWVRAKLRKESGATIGDQEMADEIATYFPEPQDGPELREQKRVARQVAEQGMIRQAGRAWRGVTQSKPPAASQITSGPAQIPTAEPGGAPQRGPVKVDY